MWCIAVQFSVCTVCSVCSVCSALQRTGVWCNAVQCSAVHWGVMRDNLAKSSLSKEQCVWAAGGQPAGDISFPYLTNTALLSGFVFICICISMFINVFVPIQAVLCVFVYLYLYFNANQCNCVQRAGDISVPYLTYTALLHGFASLYLYFYVNECICAQGARDISFPLRNLLFYKCTKL